MPYLAADSFTTAARVEALAGRGTHSASTTPTAQEVLDRMAQQGARVEAVFRRYGHPATVPSGSSPLGATGLEGTLGKLADEANAFWAAAYVLQMHDVRDTNRDVFDSLLATGDAIAGNEEKGIIGLIATLIMAGVPALSGAAVNENIEIETADLLHVTTMRF